MATDPTAIGTTNWRSELPSLAGRLVVLREIGPQDLGRSSTCCRCPTRRASVSTAGQRSQRPGTDRSSRARARLRTVVYYVITLAGVRTRRRPAGPSARSSFEAAEWECTLAPSSRGSGIFLEAARLAGSFTFGTLGAHRLEARVLLQNGRANGALRKLGAAQEGVLRRSIRRGGEYLDQVLWSMLKEDWGDHWMSTSPRVH